MDSRQSSHIGAASLIFILVLVSLFGTYLALSLDTGNVQNFLGTNTRIVTIPCPAVEQSSTTPSNNSSFPNFSSLFGNFSQMTVLLDSGMGPSNSSIEFLSSFVVLNRTSFGSQEIYAVNITRSEFEQVGSNSNITTTLTQLGNQVTMQSPTEASVFSNGTVISTAGENGSSALGLYLTDMALFYVVDAGNFPPPNSLVINSTTVSIGSTTMNVKNYAEPSVLNIDTMQSCNGSSSESMLSRDLITTDLVQAGIVPKTNFALITLEMQHLSDESSSGGVTSQFSYLFKVVSFAVAMLN